MPYVIGNARRGRWVHGVVMPLYPPYLFVRSSDAKSFAAIRRISGVRGFVMSGNEILMISSSQASACRRQWREHYRNSLPRVYSTIDVNVGDFIALPQGPLKGVPAEVVSIDKSGHVVAVIGSIRVVVELNDITKRHVSKAVRGSAEPARKSAIGDRGLSQVHGS